MGTGSEGGDKVGERKRREAGREGRERKGGWQREKW